MEKLDLSFRKNKIEYILTFFMIAFSGFPFFTGYNPIWAIVYLILVIAFIFSKKQRFDLEVFIFVGLIVWVYILQALFYDFFSIVTILTLILKFSYPYFSLKFIGKNFPRYFINFMYFISITSLFFYFIFILFPSVEIFFLNNITPFFEYRDRNDFYRAHPNFIIYNLNIHDGDLIRNSGPFWEPGGFAVFLFIALILNYNFDKNLLSKTNLTFIITILSTLSTASYLTLLIFFLLKGVTRFKFSYVLIVIVLIIPSFYYAYNNLTFLRNKVERDYEIATTPGYEKLSRNRFTSALLDIQTVAERPLLGAGKNNEMRSKKSAYFTFEDHRNNGVTGLAANYGLPFTLIYFWLMYAGLKKYYKSFNSQSQLAIVAMIIILLQGSSQVIFEKPLLIVLVYLPLILRMPNKEFVDEKIFNDSSIKIANV